MSFASRAHAEALDGFRKNNSRLSLVPYCIVISGIDLARVVSTPVEAPYFVVGHIGDHGGRFRILAEEVLANVVAAFGFEMLIFAVDTLFHDTMQ